jgi:hypothetical protein
MGCLYYFVHIIFDMGLILSREFSDIAIYDQVRLSGLAHDERKLSDYWQYR